MGGAEWHILWIIEWFGLKRALRDHLDPAPPATARTLSTRPLKASSDLGHLEHLQGSDLIERMGPQPHMTSEPFHTSPRGESHAPSSSAHVAQAGQEGQPHEANEGRKDDANLEHFPDGRFPWHRRQSLIPRQPACSCGYPPGTGEHAEAPTLHCKGAVMLVFPFC